MTKLVVEVEGEDVQEEVPKEVVKEIPPTPTKSSFKKIADLNDEEKKKIIADIQAGKESEHYELKEFKNGTFRLLKRNSQQL